MSFGFCVSDIINALGLASELYRGLREVHEHSDSRRTRYESTYDQVVSDEEGTEQ